MKEHFVCICLVALGFLFMFVGVVDKNIYIIGHVFIFIVLLLSFILGVLFTNVDKKRPNYNMYNNRKIGDIIYPAENGSGGIFSSNKWELITKVDLDGRVKSIVVFDNYISVRVIRTLMEYPELIGIRKRK